MTPFGCLTELNKWCREYCVDYKGCSGGKVSNEFIEDEHEGEYCDSMHAYGDGSEGECICDGCPDETEPGIPEVAPEV